MLETTDTAARAAVWREVETSAVKEFEKKPPGEASMSRWHPSLGPIRMFLTH